MFMFTIYMWLISNDNMLVFALVIVNVLLFDNDENAYCLLYLGFWK
jgi:hypothetical protein